MGLHSILGQCHPKLARNMVWCTKCGASQRVVAGDCFRDGWPMCCGYTMTIDSPAERAAYARTSASEQPK